MFLSNYVLSQNVFKIGTKIRKGVDDDMILIIINIFR